MSLQSKQDCPLGHLLRLKTNNSFIYFLGLIAISTGFFFSYFELIIRLSMKFINTLQPSTVAWFQVLISPWVPNSEAAQVSCIKWHIISIKSVHISLYTLNYLTLYMCVYVYTHVCVYVYTYMYIYMYIYIYMDVKND